MRIEVTRCVTSATFTAGDSVFDAKGTEESRYWILPLTNFLLECRCAKASLENDAFSLRLARAVNESSKARGTI